MVKKQQGEVVSKRQARKEEIRKRERQQRIITLSVLVLAVLVVLGLIIVPSIQKSINPAGDFVKITPVAYENVNWTSMGDPNAKVKIDVFEDFQCHACKIYGEEVEPQVIKNIVNSGMAYYVYHQFPFMDDGAAVKDSDRAAMASECAAEQNQFWNFKKLLFSNQTGINGQFSEIRLEAFAKSLGLDIEAFKTCMAENKYQTNIEDGIRLGGEMSVKGTPSVFVNGIEVTPGQVPTFTQVLQKVQEAIAASN